MPPRKSNASTAAATDANGDVSMVSNATTSSNTAQAKSSRQSGGGKQDDGVSIDDLLLPRTLVSRLARGVLPPNTSIQKDATLAIAKSATVFISYLAHHANEQTTKKTIGPQDVLKALKEIEMDGVMELGAVGKDGRLGGRLERELEAYEKILQRKRKGYRDKMKARESLAADGDDEAERGEPSSKKARRASEEEENVDDDERLLEQQLNGTGGEDNFDSEHTEKSKRKSKSSQSVANGKARASATESEVEGGDTAAEESGHGDEDDEDEEPEEEDEEDEQDDQEDEDVEDDQDDHDEEVDSVEDVDGRHRSNGTRRPLIPGRDVDVGSEDESD
ncbi:hypothetical protein HRR83_000177 [Exophiala dermatitidis]|uniref:DNA polymerase epsilon subunit D n=2 Tax=Exophiala dermatitidis TaxID=5970 RepID=H6C8J1_EXODN|nr:DNA polymerase epsilon subunit 3 [Exophiala dermatitidis NIH/UT8656]KAJ4523530.1 hypothetical protein HRR73_002713 [Exophiala dermatitidis]EHY60418.1 DNA polymerase epsilon subunit 3 [Exophiala dermatitidis NIH/UT8656]KAJ4524569.1 hypothetical protein HRR75_000159 [Exophiala dermatitidis]KAJ4527424.1 hypothetical protein HRR74_000178 [Exophiala dermatitidis]KAJ4530989.1 hypothetical protein HRR76_008675 [Exophiala dermatitidis]